MTEVRVRGARQHNLRALHLDLPLDALVVLCGPSGSGKSSLAFDTIHAEGQRRYLEALSVKLRQAAGGLPRPDVDQIAGLPPTMGLSQHGTLSSRATVGGVSEAEVVLQVLYGRAGVQHCPDSGEVVKATPHDRIVTELLAGPEGARLTIEAPVAGSTVADRLEVAARAGFSRVRVGGEVLRLDELRGSLPEGPVRVVVDRVRLGADRADRIHDAVRTAGKAGGGVIVALVDDVERVYTDRPYSFATGRTLPDLRPALLRTSGPDPCPACAGTGEREGQTCAVCWGLGLGPVARTVTFADRRYDHVLTRPLGKLRQEVQAWTGDEVGEPLLVELRARLAALDEVGLGHLPLATPASQLSSGESQRLRLAAQVGSDLSGVLYVLDEPSLGLGEDQVHRIVGMLRGLLAKGNGVLVVDHHPELLRAADRVIEFGPGPGRLGGRIVFDGTPAELARADTTTGRWLAGLRSLQPAPARDLGAWTVPGAVGRNLVGADLVLRRGALNTLWGPSGSGKSAALEAIGSAVDASIDGSAQLLGLEGVTRLLRVDAVEARRSRRSMAATYTGFWDTMRELLAATQEARTRALEASRFSLNVVGGRCEGCQGLGVRRVDLELLPPVDVLCDVCEGRRFASDVLEVRWKGLHAGQLLDLCADEALPLLAGHPKLEEPLRALRDVGLGYVPLGQPTHSFSGGEARRLVLARELVRAHRRGAAELVILLDEPTAGLHPEDVASLHALLQRLALDGATLVIATHDQGLARASDHVVVLGPGAGPEGGRVLASGPPAESLV